MEKTEQKTYSLDSMKYVTAHEKLSAMKSMVLSHQFMKKSDGDDGVFPYGLVIDDACHMEWLEKVQNIRESLPLNSKRPTVDRRFLCDTNQDIVTIIESIVYQALCEEGFVADSFTIYCNKYLRILEYNKEGAELLPHSDGTKVCDVTGQKSTHTLLLFLSNCKHGGETIIMDGQGTWSKETNLVVPNEKRLQELDTNHNNRYDLGGDHQSSRHISLGICPKIGRILLFPHYWPHAGAMCLELPKIVLRAELTLVQK